MSENDETKPDTGALPVVGSTGGFGYFAAPCSKWEDGWWGPAKSRDEAIRAMLSTWDDDPLTACVTAKGYEVTPETYPELYDEDGCMSEWEYQVERPHETHALPLPNT